MEIKLKLKNPGWKFWSALGVVLAIVVGLYLYQAVSSKNPIPKEITSQASFKAVYPSDIGIVSGGKSSGFKYQSQQKTIVFKAVYQGVPLLVTQQTAPSNLVNGTGAYFQSIGLHPVAQFDSKLGPVAIVNFYKTGTLEPVGQTGVLIAGKTMLIANTTDDKAKPTNEQWKNFFDSLKQAK